MSRYLFGPVVAARNFIHSAHISKVYCHSEFCYLILNGSLMWKFRPATILVLRVITGEKFIGEAAFCCVVLLMNLMEIFKFVDIDKNSNSIMKYMNTLKSSLHNMY
jgi:hypothetical protein